MANPTTNYGFVLPTPTDLVTDLPADFDVALQGVDTRLKALQPGTTLGDIAYSSATANTNTRLAIGSTGNVLTVAGGVPTWAAPAGGGKVLQVVFGSTSAGTSSNSTTFATTNLTATITPTLATSKVLVLVSQNGCVKTTNNIALVLRLRRDATTIANLEGNGGNTNSTATNGIGSISTAYLDTPATTSATTYLTQFATSAANNQVTVQDSLLGNTALSTIILMEIGA